MKKTLVLLTAFLTIPLIIHSVAAQATEVSDHAMEEAMATWENRANREGTEEAIRLFESIVAKKQDHTEALVKLSQAYYWLGSVFVKDPEAKKTLFKKGEACGSRALDLDAENLGAMYWTANNIARWAELFGMTKSALNIGKVKDFQSKVLERDETFFHAGSHLFWGAYHGKAPKFFGRDYKKSTKHFKRAIEIEPNYLRAYQLYVQNNLLRRGKREEAREMLKKALATPSDALLDAIPENEVAKRNCRRILKKEFGEE